MQGSNFLVWFSSHTLQIVFLSVFIVAAFLGVKELIFQLPRLQVWLHVDPIYTSEEKQLLDSLGRGYTTSEYQKIYLQAQRIARKKPPYVEIGSCQLNPAVIRVPVGSVVRFYNDDSRLHTLSFENRSFPVPAQSFMNIRLDMYTYLPALYAYYCDGKTARVGAVFIDSPRKGIMPK